MEKLLLPKYKKLLFAAAGTLIIITAVVMLTRPEEDTEEDVIWREYQVAYNDITASLDGGGALETADVHHSAAVDLKVEEIMVEIGQEVKTGDVLVKYSMDGLKEKIRELNASLQKAQRSLEDAKNNKQKVMLENKLNSNETLEGTQTAYENSKRDLENAIRTTTQKIRQLEERNTKLNQELENMEASDDGSMDSAELKVLKDELAKLQDELAKLQGESSAGNNNTQSSSLKQQSSPSEQSGVGSTDSDAIKKKQAEIDEIQKKISELSSKEEKIASLKEQIIQAQLDLQAAQFEYETQQNALNILNSNHDKQGSQNQENQGIREQIDAIVTASLNNAIKNAQDDVEKIRESLAEANENLSAPELTAKADGVVTELKYAVGDDVPAGKSIVTVGRSSEKRVVTQVSQEDMGGVEIGQSVEMQFLAAPDETLKGRVVKKSLVPSEGGDGITYKVTMAFDEEQPELLQGMTCGVKFILKRVEHVLTLSNKAIKLENGKQMVTVLLPDGTHEEREIQTGFSDGRVSEITGGLSEGETVVTAG